MNITDSSKRPRIEVGRHGMVFQHPGVTSGVPLQQLMPTAQGTVSPMPAHQINPPRGVLALEVKDLPDRALPRSVVPPYKLVLGVKCLVRVEGAAWQALAVHAGMEYSHTKMHIWCPPPQ